MRLGCGGGGSFYCPCTKSYRGSCNPVDYFAEYTIATYQKHVNQTNIEDVKQLTKGELSIIDVWLACGRGGWGVSKYNICFKSFGTLCISEIYLQAIPKLHAKIQVNLTIIAGARKLIICSDIER